MRTPVKNVRNSAQGILQVPKQLKLGTFEGCLWYGYSSNGTISDNVPRYALCYWLHGLTSLARRQHAVFELRPILHWVHRHTTTGLVSVTNTMRISATYPVPILTAFETKDVYRYPRAYTGKDHHLFRSTHFTHAITTMSAITSRTVRLS